MKTVNLLIRAYIELLKVEREDTRLNLERTYCILRDEISTLSGNSIEKVQATCEQIALQERLLAS